VRVDLSCAPPDFKIMVLQSMSFSDRFTCALVCKSWAEAATAATHSIILRDSMQDISCLQGWIKKHGNHLEVLQLHECDCAAMTALPCPQLQDLLLTGCVSINGSVWRDVAAATKLTSVLLAYVMTPSQQADVVSALTALPDLQQLTWRDVDCCGEAELCDSSLLLQMTQLTYLELQDVTAAALQHLSSLAKLQHLSITPDDDWAAAGCPGLQELNALTRLCLFRVDDIPANVSELPALRRLEASSATLAAANALQVLTALTQLKVWLLRDLADQSLQLQLTSLLHLELGSSRPYALMPMLFLASCKQLQVLSLLGFFSYGPRQPGGQRHTAAPGA